jgi:hypothetical protein
VRAEVDVLVADDEPADVFVVRDDRVGQSRAAVGARETAGGEVEVAERRREGGAVGRLRREQPDGLVDRFDVSRRPCRAAGVRRHVPAAAVEVDAGVVVQDVDGQQPPLFQRLDR